MQYVFWTYIYSNTWSPPPRYINHNYFTEYSRLDQVKFVEDSHWKIWSDKVCLNKPHQKILLQNVDVFNKFFQVFFLNTSSQIINQKPTLVSLEYENGNY